MCLLVVAWSCVDHWPLIVGANRDEWLDRPATAMAVLREERPRILGGRDERAGGTWLAVNQYGVVCGLTNRPIPEGPDPGKLSRGRLPLVAAMARTAGEAAEALALEATAGSYNPAWLLVGDRSSLYYLGVGDDQAGAPRRLDPGLHVLENSPLDSPSVKVDHVLATLTESSDTGVPLWDALPAVLGSHAVPAAPSGVHHFPDGRERLEATLASCVHSDGYGTRSSAMVRVGERSGDLPDVLVADGPPCTAPFVDVGSLWGSTSPR